MNAARYLWPALCVLAMVVGLAGCETAAPAVPTPTLVVIEGEATCPIENFKEASSTTIQDPELGPSDRAFFISWSFGCDVPYLKGRSYGLQDGYFVGDDYYWTGQYEVVSEEGGVWTGFGYNQSVDGKFSAHGTYLGSKEYQGLQMALELAGDQVKYKVTNALPEENGSTQEAETLVLEKELTCSSMKSSGSQGYTNPNVPQLANVEWARMMSRVYTCDEPYLEGKMVSFVNHHTAQDPGEIIMFSELVTDEDGAWVGTCQGTMTQAAQWPEKAGCTFEGASIYKGLRMTMDWEGDVIKLRIVKPEAQAAETGG